MAGLPGREADHERGGEAEERGREAVAMPPSGVELGLERLEHGRDRCRRSGLPMISPMDRMVASRPQKVPSRPEEDQQADW